MTRIRHDPPGWLAFYAVLALGVLLYLGTSLVIALVRG